MLRVGDIVTTTVGLPYGAHPEFVVNRVWRTDAGEIECALHNYPGRHFREDELTLSSKSNICPHQFAVGERVVNVETDTIDVIDTANRTAKGVMYTLENSLKFKYDKDLRPANYTLF